MHPDTNLVIQIQSFDQKIAAFEKEIATLPKHIAAIEKTLDSHNRKLEADKAALNANQKERKTKELDIQAHEQKISKLKDQTLGAKNNEQYRAFQNEIDFIQKEIRKAEDRILELMSEAEPLDLNVKKAEVALKEEKKHVESEKSTARDRTAQDQKWLEEVRESRKAALGQLSPKTVQSYERIRKKWSGIVISEVQEGRCTACQIALRPQYFQQLRRVGRIDVLRKLRKISLLQSARQLRKTRLLVIRRSNHSLRR